MYEDDANRAQFENDSYQEVVFNEVSWVQVNEAVGVTQASLIVAYLTGQGIKAVAWQEGAGKAIGITVGALGTTTIMVQEQDEDLARSLLETEVDPNEYVDWEDYPASLSGFAKVTLGAVALAIDPIGTGIALGLSYLLSKKAEDDSASIVT